MELLPDIQTLREPEVVGVQYPRRKIPLGFDEINTKSFLISLKEPRVAVIVSKRGDGKTHLEHGVGDRYNVSGHRIHIWHDKKSEYLLAHKPNPHYESQLKWEMRECGIESRAQFMPYAEQPRGVDELHYYSPEFCPQDGTEKFSFRVTDVILKDLQELIAVYEGHSNRRIISKLIYNCIAEHRVDFDNARLTKNRLYELVLNYKEYLKRDKADCDSIAAMGEDILRKEVVRLWDDFFEYGVFEGENLMSFEEFIGFGEYNTEINWQAFREGITNAAKTNKDIYLASWLLKEFEWAKMVRNKSLEVDTLIMLDELQDILIGGNYPYTLSILKLIVEEGREYGIHLWMAFQSELEKIPEIFRSNIDLLIIGSTNATRQSLNYLKETYSELLGSKANVLEFKKIPRHHFLVIDKHRELDDRYTVLMPYPHLSEHFTVRGRV